jgi:hypothetical protein
MRKIGILTFHWANSFGAILQAYALNKLLIDMGYDAEIINFLPGLRLVTSRVIKPHELARKYSAMGFSLIRGAYSASGEAINYIFDFKEYLCRDRLFGDFRKKFMKISPQVVNDVSELKKKHVRNMTYVLSVATKFGIQNTYTTQILPIYFLLSLKKRRK